MSFLHYIQKVATEVLPPAPWKFSVCRASKTFSFPNTFPFPGLLQKLFLNASPPSLPPKNVSSPKMNEHIQEFFIDPPHPPCLEQLVYPLIYLLRWVADPFFSGNCVSEEISAFS